METQALCDLKVVEFGELISAPYCAKLLADLGADVIKIEQPDAEDKARKMGSFPDDIPDNEKSGLFLALNFNKLGITLNVDSKLGRKIFKELVRGADVLVESNPPALMRSLGLDYDNLKKVNPRLIMTSITPFGQTGPYRDYKGTDLITFHISGYGYVTPGGGVKDPEREPPLRAGGHQADFFGGVIGALATVFAIFARRNSGNGQFIDVSKQESISFLGLRSYASYLLNKSIPTRMNFGLMGTAAQLPTKNGYVTMTNTNEEQWQNWLKVMGNPSWAESELFKDRLSRSANWDVLEELMAQWTTQYTKEEISEMAQARHCACLPVNTTAEVWESDHLAARQFFVNIDHPRAGSLRYPGAPYRLSRTPWQVRHPAPLLGQHNEEIFCHRLGYSKQELVKMRQFGVI